MEKITKTPMYFVAFAFRSKDQEGNGMQHMSGPKHLFYSDIAAWVAWLDENIKDQYGAKCKCIVTFYKRLV